MAVTEDKSAKLGPMKKDEIEASQLFGKEKV